MSVDVRFEPRHLVREWRELASDMVSEQLPSRLWAGDPALFTTDADQFGRIVDRLGWVGSPQWLGDHVEELTDFAVEIKRAGFQHIILLGMGGSSLCPEVLSNVRERPPWLSSFAIVDSTHPNFIQRIEQRIDLRSTLFIVASKSGSTIETRSQAAYFFHQVKQVSASPGDQFVAITDPGSDLETSAREQQYRRIFLNPPDIGGRFSALSYFGMLPAALLEFPLQQIAINTQRMADRLRDDLEDNPAVSIAAMLALCARSGRDKLPFIAAGRGAALVPWIEQLVAESTGKNRIGIVPIDSDTPPPDTRFHADRVYAHLRFSNQVEPDRITDGTRNAPNIYFTLEDNTCLGAFFLLWKAVTALTGHLLGINPFDEPNVKESKEITGRLLTEFQTRGHFSELHSMSAGDPVQVVSPAALDLDDAFTMRNFISSASAGDYIAFLYFGDRVAATELWLQHLREITAKAVNVTTLRGYGPRYLHSIGQLFKGGPATGHFVVITHDVVSDIPIPGEPYSFANLIDAQAFGDIEALIAHKRPVIRVHLNGPLRTAQGQFTTIWANALKAVKSVVLE